MVVGGQERMTSGSTEAEVAQGGQDRVGLADDDEGVVEVEPFPEGSGRRLRSAVLDAALGAVEALQRRPVCLLTSRRCAGPAGTGELEHRARGHRVDGTGVNVSIETLGADSVQQGQGSRAVLVR